MIIHGTFSSEAAVDSKYSGYQSSHPYLQKTANHGLTVMLRPDNYWLVFLEFSSFFPGVHSVAYAFPKVKIVTGAVDPEVNEYFHIIPGIG